MHTDITLIAHTIWARKFKAKANISSRKLFLAGQKIAGNLGLDMLLHYVTQDKNIFISKAPANPSGLLHLASASPAHAPLHTSRLDFLLLPCPPSSLLFSTRFNLTSIHTGKIKRLHPHKSLDHPCLCCWWQSHKHMGSALSAWCNIKTPGMSFPNAGEKDLLQAPGVAKPSISHLLPSHLPFQVSNIQLPVHWQS